MFFLPQRPGMQIIFFVLMHLKSFPMAAGKGCYQTLFGRSVPWLSAKQLQLHTATVQRQCLAWVIHTQAGDVAKTKIWLTV